MLIIAFPPWVEIVFQLLEEKETNLAFSADVTSAQQLLELADQIGPKIAL